jgi:dTDP-4-dehydrorhamnose reductase
MKVAVIGADGQLGYDIVAGFSGVGDVAAITHADVEISVLESVKNTLNSLRPDLVVNTAAFHHVEKCEADPALAFAVNGLGARHVAQVTDSLGAKLVHISTDYVFDGKKQAPYAEDDSAAPLNVYGNSKLSGEFFVRCSNPRHFVVRVSAIYGSHPCRAKGGLNFVELMLKLSKEKDELRVVDDEFVTPTPTIEIAQQLMVLSRTSEYGLYHATAEGSCSWYEFARAIFDLTATRVRLERAKPGEFPAKVPRPKYSVLENASLKTRSLNVFGDWRQGLENYLAQRETATIADRTRVAGRHPRGF